MTVTPTIVDVDYTYLVLKANVLYDSKKTVSTAAQISNLVKNGTITFCNNTLNTFNSTFVIGDLISYIKGLEQSIVAVDFDLYLQKRFVPTLNSTQTYTINFGTSLERGYGDEALAITPSFAQYDSQGNYYPTVYFEVSPDNTTNIDSVSIVSGQVQVNFQTNTSGWTIKSQATFI